MRRYLALALFTVVACHGAPGLAEESGSGETAPVAAPPPPFQPPLLGAPGDRISAATRGEEARQDGILTVVAPLGGGLTVSGQPVLLWHLAEASSAVLRLEIVVADQAEPWLVYLDEDGLAAGFHRLDLGALGLRMPADRIYRLRLSLGDPAGPPSAVHSFIERVPAEPHLAAALAAPATDTAALAALAGAGLWWDYIDRLSTEAQLVQAAAEQGLELR